MTQVSSPSCAMCACTISLRTLQSQPTGSPQARLRLERHTRAKKASPDGLEGPSLDMDDISGPFPGKDGPLMVHWECRRWTEAALHCGGQGCGGKHSGADVSAY